MTGFGNKALWGKVCRFETLVTDSGDIHALNTDGTYVDEGEGTTIPYTRTLLNATASDPTKCPGFISVQLKVLSDDGNATTAVYLTDEPVTSVDGLWKSIKYTQVGISLDVWDEDKLGPDPRQTASLPQA